jgi:hypothetical protein
VRPNVEAVDLGRPIREGYIARMAAQPEIERCEIYLQGFSKWEKAQRRYRIVYGHRFSSQPGFFGSNQRSKT